MTIAANRAHGCQVRRAQPIAAPSTAAANESNPTNLMMTGTKAGTSGGRKSKFDRAIPKIASAGNKRSTENASHKTPSSLTWLLIPFWEVPTIAFPQAGQNLCPSLISVPQLSQNNGVTSFSKTHLQPHLFEESAGTPVSQTNSFNHKCLESPSQTSP
jgi:hypothetical protein